MAEGDEAVWIGDFNLEQAQLPLSDWIASGSLRQCDDANQASVLPTGTATVAGDRVIDFALYRGRLVLSDREQHALKYPTTTDVSQITIWLCTP